MSTATITVTTTRRTTITVDEQEVQNILVKHLAIEGKKAHFEFDDFGGGVTVYFEECEVETN